MVNPLVLSLLDLNKPFIVKTDASCSGIGTMLMQERHPIANINKALGLGSKCCPPTRERCWISYRQ
jgi:hypothetical protein